jgi:hypothetical protein
MDWTVGRAGLRAIGAAVFGFAAFIFASVTPSAASSYTLNFSGTVTASSGLFIPLGVTGGDAVSGSITFDPFNATSATSGINTNTFAQSAASFTFHVSHPGVLDFTRTDTGTGEIRSVGGVTPALAFFTGSPNTNLNLGFETTGPGAALTSLTALPTNPSALLALLGGGPLLASGVYSVLGFGGASISFDIAFSPVAVAATPIPAALPLFGTGLAMLGFAARRRRAQQRAAA